MATEWTDTFDINAQMAVIRARLRWPAPEIMSPFYRKLLENPGSCVVLTLETPRGPNGPAWKAGWLSSEERNMVRKDLQRINERRSKTRQPLTTESPDATQEGNLPKDS
jgi:hypothetical protein